MVFKRMSGNCLQYFHEALGEDILGSMAYAVRRRLRRQDNLILGFLSRECRGHPVRQELLWIRDHGIHQLTIIKI